MATVVVLEMPSRGMLTPEMEALPHARLDRPVTVACSATMALALVLEADCAALAVDCAEAAAEVAEAISPDRVVSTLST